MSKKYTIGLDFGTLSGRAVLVSVSDGEELGYREFSYPHAVMDGEIPTGRKLKPESALQYPQDYLDALANTVPQLLSECGVDRRDVIGVGVDFTACTIMPVYADGTPLCMTEKWSDEPNAYVKLWKHHGAQKYADMINDLAEARGEAWLKRYGGKTSCEWAFAKMLETYSEARGVYDDADIFIEAGDWLVMKLCGSLKRSACMAGYKALWSREDGYPGRDFFGQLSEGFAGAAEDKLRGEVVPAGAYCGGLTEEAAELLGLEPGTAVAACIIDAHAAVPSLGGDCEGKMLMIIGTSTCHISLSDKLSYAEGICGVVLDGVMPGFYAYEAGQACVGDCFAWFIDNCVPESYMNAAREKGMNIHKYLRSLAGKKKPGENRLIALDWWNGNRSVLGDSRLSGLILGLNVGTKPEDIYRALIESTAYGTRMIVDNYGENGVPVKEIYATGGIADKDPFTMQIYADVLGREIRIAGASNGPALGSAIFAAAAAGAGNGGYRDAFAASEAMGRVRPTVYRPIPENAAAYERLFREYRTLHDYFGRGGNGVMKRLKEDRV